MAFVNIEQEDRESGMNLKKTQRGFAYMEFLDTYGAECSLQESSSVDPHIWFGMDKDNDGSAVGKTVDGKQLGARMHLSQRAVQELLPYLAYFAAYGILPLMETEADHPDSGGGA